MEKITAYKAQDGSIWTRKSDAESREFKINRIDEILSPLKHRPCDPSLRFANGYGYIQQDENIVSAVRSALVAEFPNPYASPPAEMAWIRLLSIDSMGREWGQPYFATHPNPAAKRLPD